MWHRIRALATTAALAALLAGCASGGAPAAPAPTGTPAQQAALARYLTYAGPPIAYFTWLGHFYSWEPLGKDTLVVFTVPDEAYLLKVWPPCDLRFVINAIGITSTARTVYAHTDSITTNSAETGPGRWRCPIDEIRKIDYRRMRADQRAQAQQSKAGQPNLAPPPAPAAAPPSTPQQ
ncbi:MAG: DUF6491 family protein [Steroidobacteraceae bacterium]